MTGPVDDGPVDEGPIDEGRVGGFVLTSWRTATGRLLADLAQRVARLVGPHALLVATLLVSGLLLVGLTTASAELYDEVVDAEGIATLDAPALALARDLRSPAANTAVTAFTDLGGPVGMPLLAAGATLLMALGWRRWTPVVLMAAGAAGSLAMTVAGKAVVGRTRPALVDAVPPYESSPSFPSGHALNSVVLAAIVAYLLVRRQTTARARALTVTAAATFAFLMGLSRVYLGHHWLTDVLAAWTLGLAWAVAVVTAHRLFLTVRRSGTVARTSYESEE
ncbi:MAG: hypothetical protein JWN08_876 [Frankiales bacterium]|nr:hypothetical protein [Frankiales bacterium]